jgi:hypothetical protein
MLRRGCVLALGLVAFCHLQSTAGAAEAPRFPLGPPGLELTYARPLDASRRGTDVERCIVDLGRLETRGNVTGQWLRLRATKANGESFAVWWLGRGYPARRVEEAGSTAWRYLVQVGPGPTREFAHRNTGQAVLPSSGGWEFLWPRPLGGESRIDAAAVRWLGHEYRLEQSGAGEVLAPPVEVQRLDLLPDVLVGVPSNQRTQDDTRRFDGSDYPMIRLSREDYAGMIRAGLNCFRVDAEQSRWLVDQPVFRWGPGGADVPWPDCLLDSTYLGPVLFLDEPAVGTRDRDIRPRLAQDAVFRHGLSPQTMFTAFQTHFREAVRSGAPGAFLAGMRGRADVELGGIDFRQGNLFTWETMIASAAWQLTAEPAGSGGPRAVVFEPPGRLGTRRTVPELNMAYGCELSPLDSTAFADVIIGFLRGAARASDGAWGVSIYGAVDRADAPGFLTHAYDLGATHFFFWDNYQLACVPHGECLGLARHLAAHAQSHPDRDQGRLRRAGEVALLLPPGYDLGHVHMGRGNLWGLGELNLERTNRYGVRFRQVMGNLFTEIERCLRLGSAFDVLWDLESLPLEGYREVVRLRENGRVEVAADGARTVLAGPRRPVRAVGRGPGIEVEVVGVTGTVPCTPVARARVREGAAPVYYTTGADRRGVQHNAAVLWELYGPEDEDYRTLLEPGADPVVTRSGETLTVEVRFRVGRAGVYRLRAATCDLAGRSAVAWARFQLGP